MITLAAMKALEASSGIPLQSLMERCANAFVTELRSNQELKGKKILVACYHGTNAGEGFAIADLLANDAEVDMLFIGDEEKMQKETAHFFKMVNDNPLVQFVALDTVDFSEYDVIIDAILGINMHTYLKPEIATTIKLINESSAFKVAVDIPTGLHPDSGKVVEEVLNADLIITFHDLKPALESLQEKVKIVGIGL
jgi:ADP-dependent NAD(P)H-hydrate dehydratase / NAD(P)H-hydrate epimerase